MRLSRKNQLKNSISLASDTNDLYQWKPDKNTVNLETHPLKALQREGTATSFNELIRNVPLDKIGRIEEMISNLENDGR